MPQRKKLSLQWTTRWATVLILAPTALLFHDWMTLTGIVSLSALSDLVFHHLFSKAPEFASANRAAVSGEDAFHKPSSSPALEWDWLGGAILLLVWGDCSFNLENPGNDLFQQRLFWFIYVGLPPLLAASTRMTARWLFRWRSRSKTMSGGDMLDVLLFDGSTEWIGPILGMLICLLYPPIASNPQAPRLPVPLILCTLFYAAIHAVLGYALVVSQPPFGIGGLAAFLGIMVMLILAGSCWVSLPEHKSLLPPPKRRTASKKRRTAH
ncbi:hypothetical protein JKG68_09295 [Microvirga aerilata]|uniref:Uncharacterized protein n=1 Tax=Microvirga aerilata TaxID=670292 RepID=A0A937CXJ9_9HYPH|nr:hypothetical protein [Microvirga aerilata]MBL0404159.1 hypothetical protein [Microvirga aerilata]